MNRANAEAATGRTEQQVAQQGKAATPSLGASPSPSVPAAPAAAASVPNWALNCSNRTGGNFTCEMTQAMVDGANGALVLLISISTPQENAPPVVVFRAAHGFFLPAGLNIRIDNGKPTQIEFQKSDQIGVYAAFPLTAQLVGELKKSRELALALEVNKGTKVEFKTLMVGFSAAYDRVTAKN